MCRRITAAAALALLVGCATLRHRASAPDSAQILRAYESGVRNAAVARKESVATDLIAIDHVNHRLLWDAGGERVLVVTWKSESSYERFLRGAASTSSDEANVVWVTAAPQVQEFCRRFAAEDPSATSAQLALRLKQYLGLNPEWSYDVFVELWVRPADMFRPCVDPEITDSICNLDFSNPPPVVKGIADYRRFYEHLYFEDFRTSPGVPWTGLGYTYDWGNHERHEGASEFILTPGAGYEIRDAIPTADYCR
ncbi:MAG TPA: hypothetical protein VGL62_03945 [Vicinamibacterales bacterium]